MFLSIIIPVYNAENYIDECIQSLLNQNIDKENYEIICVNDGSKDKSREILRKYEILGNVKIVDQENAGIGAARNVGLDIARGEYIWFIDADDFIQENIMADLLVKIKNSKCDRLQMNVYTFYNNLNEDEKELKKNRKISPNVYYYAVVVWNSILKRDFLLSNNIKFHYPELAYSEDQVFMHELLMKNPDTVVYDEVVYFYRRNKYSVTADYTKIGQEKNIESGIKVANIMREYYLDGGNERASLADSLMSNIWMALFAISKLPKKEANVKIKKMKAAQLYPFRRPQECTLKKSYQTTRTDIVGKVFDILYTNLHTRWGYTLMRLFNLMRKIRNKKRG